jgi:hypothetical protein
VVLVLGEVRQMRKIGEGAHDIGSLFTRETVENAFQFALGGKIVVASKSHRGLPDALDPIERSGAFLKRERVAQDAPQQPNVLP